MKISYSFIALLCFLYFIDSSGVFIYFLIASFIHEIGHILAIYICGGKIHSLKLSVLGANMDYSFSNITSYKTEIFINSAGILINIVTAILFSYLGINTLAGASIILAIFNSLPIMPLDGGKILTNIFSYFYDPYISEIILYIVSIILAFILLILGVYILIISKYNISILLIGVFMLIKLYKEKTLH